jgi:hypothetical protein
MRHRVGVRSASLIAAATADRSVLAIGHDFEVIPVMAFQAINGDFMAGDQVLALPDTARCPVKPSLRSQPGAAALLFFAVGMLGTSGAS